MTEVQNQTNQNLASSDFLLAIIHELKTPLSGIIGFCEIACDALAAGNEEELASLKKKHSELLEYLKYIAAAANDLDEIIHDLLEVGLAAVAGFSVDLSGETNLGEMLRRSARLNQDYAMKMGVILFVEISSEIEGKMFKLDSKRMKQILANLINNAVKYSPKGSEVKVSCKKVGEFLEILVADQGFGMSKDELKIAFEKYRTVKNPHSGMVDSFGLGLPIVKQLVEAQNGKIEIESEKGKGTKVKLIF